MFSITLVTVDSYQATPIHGLDITFSDFRGTEIRQVPVIRAFGSTSTGVKTCLHIHGVFPYIYVPCTIEGNVSSYMYRLAAAIDSAINVSIGSATSNRQHVYKMQKVSGVPFYGYHQKEHLFVKIYFYNPAMIKRAADLLQNGAVLNQSLQPHEAHIPFIQQFMIDYNLYGMSLINVSSVKHRRATCPDSKENSQNDNSMNAFDSQKYLPSFVVKQSICELEVDTQATAILNREEILNGIELNPGIAAIWNDERARRDAKGLQHAASQLVYSVKADNRKINFQTENDLYQEERLAQRLQLISQSDESTSSLSTTVLSYPLEAEHNDNSLNASHIFNHFNPRETKQRNRKENEDNEMNNKNGEEMELKMSGSSEENQIPKNDIDASFLDTEDMQLVEILANLAEASSAEKIVDNDSVLGSQYSMLSVEIKDTNEEEEIEDLNITSLDLDSLSSWNSVTKPASQTTISDIDTENKNIENRNENTNELENELEDASHLNLPQCDGTNDSFVENDTSFVTKPYRQEVTEYKNKEMAAIRTKKCKKFICENLNNTLLRTCQLDHKNLDVYDVEEAECALHMIKNKNLRGLDSFRKIQKTSAKSEQEYTGKSLCDEQKKSLVKFIPAFDGNTADSSSDSEIDQDMTIERQEKRICIYKSGPKSTQKNVISITPRKRLMIDDIDGTSPNKRRNVASDILQSGSHLTPTKKRIPNSPQTISRKYTPLDITITSPRVNKNPIQKDEASISEPGSPKTSITSICNTAKRRVRALRINLLREMNCGLSPKQNSVNSDDQNKTSQEMLQTNELNNTESTKSYKINKDIAPGDSQKESSNLLEEYKKKHSILKTTKEVRKRLSFLYTDEKQSTSLENTIDNNNYENLALVESMINQSNEGNDLINASISIFNKTQYGINQDEIEKETTNSHSVFPSISKHGTSTCIENLTDQTIIISGETTFENISEDEEELCNMTFTQYINKKLEDGHQSFIGDSISATTKNKLITITPKFNSPSRARITESIKLYGIAEYKSKGPFFSNKADLIKHNETSNKKESHIQNVLPFKSGLDGITGIKLWRRMKVNEFHPSGANIKSSNMKRALAGYNSIIIKPLINPPSLKSIGIWLHAQKYRTRKTKKADAVNDCQIIDKEDKNADSRSKTTESHNEKDVQLLTNVLKTKEEQIDQIEVNKSKHSQQMDHSAHSNSSSDTINSSTKRLLENSLLHRNNQTQQHLGISYGQIEFSIKGNSGSVTDENFQNAKGVTAYQYLTLLSLEVHVNTRGELLPDPEHDPIEALFYAVHNDIPESIYLEQKEHGAMIVSSSGDNLKFSNLHSIGLNCSISYVDNEEELLKNLIKLIRDHNPDILLGWELETLSWGYVFQRASHIGLNNFIWQISRIPNVAPVSGPQTDNDNTYDTKIPGRIVLDVWRIMRHEAALLNYTFENIMYHVMRERIPCPTFKTLTNWWKHINLVIRWRVISHYTVRVLGTLRILTHLDIIGRTCEHARLFGILFYEVFSRGSQFRVESMMLRLAKPLNYIPVSPSVQQRARMRAPESLPLIMEPQSIFYTDPLIVLDFQSLYPSIIIAYNYCFSTCLGRIEHIGQYDPYEFGATTLRIKKSTALKLRGKINFAPCGVAFVKSEVRQGILPRMLTEILNTRLMVKESMKLHGSENRVLQRVLDSQQLGLKLIANVTYGYTAANFSGRMPCIEIADSVVSKGRETLERAIKIVESTPQWGAQVVYGDTDSLFVLLPGKSKSEAFTVGADIANTVTAANPPPVKLKFEKVLYPSILQTKKRYCGYMYEDPEQREPELLAKGIETVRRDGCPAVAKILEKSLKILFDTKDISLIKSYVTRQFDKILRRKISIQDLTFAKEFRGLQGYKATACVPALELTRRLIRKDPRAIPRTSERVRYVIVSGAPNQALIHCVRTPMEVISDEGLSPNSVYYITKVIIPPLNRCFNLFGIDVNVWYREMAHRQTPDKVVSLFMNNPKSTIRQFFSTVVCATCGAQSKTEICVNCMSQPNQAITILYEKIRSIERTYHKFTSICQSCTGFSDEPQCESLDCPVLYRLAQARRDLIQIPYLNNIISGGDKVT